MTDWSRKGVRFGMRTLMEQDMDMGMGMGKASQGVARPKRFLKIIHVYYDVKER